MRAVRLILLLALSFPASRSPAQRLTSRFPTTSQFRSTPHAATPQPRSNTGAIVGGVLGAAFGTIGGGLVTVATLCGGVIGGCNSDAGAILTWGLSEAVFAALGSHAGNRRAGNLALDFLAAAAISTGGLTAYTATESPVILVLTPIVQIAVLVAVERATGARRGAAAQPGG